MNYYYENTDDLFLEVEIFKNIAGYDGDYQVSNLGRIKSFKRKDIIILSQIKGEGYLRVKLSKNGKGKPKRIHDLMFESFNNYKLKENECVHHINENKSDNLLDNFQLMSVSEHMSLHTSERTGEKNHMFGKTGKNHPMFGRTGEKSGHHILTEHNVIKIRELLDEGILTQKEIAEMFGVNQTAISDIKTGRRWKHI